MKKRYALLGFVLSVLFGVGLPVIGYLFCEKAKEVELANLSIIEIELIHLPSPMYYDYYPYHRRHGKYSYYDEYDQYDEEYEEPDAAEIDHLIGKISDESCKLQDLLSDLKSLCKKEEKRQEKKYYKVKVNLRVTDLSCNNYIDRYYDGDSSYLKEELEEIVRANERVEAILSYLRSLHQPGLLAGIKRIIDHCFHKPFKAPCDSEK